MEKNTYRIRSSWSSNHAHLHGNTYTSFRKARYADGVGYVSIEHSNGGAWTVYGSRADAFRDRHGAAPHLACFVIETVK
jgi:hypothetical protein